MTQPIQRVNWICQRMKNQMSGIERRILAVPQEAPKGVPLGELKKLPPTYITELGVQNTKENVQDVRTANA